jgi:hypothetical protein
MAPSGFQSELVAATLLCDPSRTRFDDEKEMSVLGEQWWRTVSDAAQIWTAAPQVIALRSVRVLADRFALRADTRRELARMAQEKTAAAGESAAAVALQVWKTNWELALIPLRLWWGMGAGAAWRAPFMPVSGGAAQKQLAAAASRIAQSGLRPVHRRVTANAKRLRRRKSSR